MQQDYKVFKENTPIEVTNQYFQQCIDEEKVQIVIKTMRKYARIEYDFITLDNTKRGIEDLSQCNIDDKIRIYALAYAEEHKLSTDAMHMMISSKSGAFKFYIEDIDKVGNDICKIILDVRKSGCIKYITIEEKLKTMDPDIIAALKGEGWYESGK